MALWWRAYAEAATDPKLQLLPPELFRTWFNLMCIAAGNDGVLPALAHVAYTLQMKPEKAAQALAQLHKAGLLDKTETGFAPHNWSGRQYKSDVSTERVKRFRNGGGNVSRNVSETPSEAETETETDSEAIASERSPPKRARAKPRSSLPDPWRPDEQDLAYAQQRGFSLEQARTMGMAFANHHRGKGSLMADWHAAWRTWVDNEIKFHGGRNGNRTSNPRRTGHDAILAAASRQAREMSGDGDMAGPTPATEFPFGDGAFGSGSKGRFGANGGPASRFDGREPSADAVLEGEIIAPDQASAGLSGGWRGH